MSITLISATPSPFARMNRIALHEKGIPFELKNEIPWHSDSETPIHNPLEKLPIMLFDDGREPVYDSAHIQNYIVAKYADKPPLLLTGDLDLDLKARQILTLCEGILDASVLMFWETQRGEDKISTSWLARQRRKLDGGLKALEALAKSRPAGSDFLLPGGEMTIADIAVGCTVAQIAFYVSVLPYFEDRKDWKSEFPELAKYWQKLEERETFKMTSPTMFDLKPDTVM